MTEHIPEHATDAGATARRVFPTVLVPPIVARKRGNPIEDPAVLEAMVEAGETLHDTHRTILAESGVDGVVEVVEIHYDVPVETPPPSEETV